MIVIGTISSQGDVTPHPCFPRLLPNRGVLYPYLTPLADRQGRIQCTNTQRVSVAGGLQSLAFVIYLAVFAMSFATS